MLSLKFYMIFVFLLSLSSSMFTFTGAADPTYVYHACSDNNFTRNSTYQSNLNLLLSSFPPNASRSNGFYQTTAGQDPNRVYGLFQCRGDVTTTTCQDCVDFASTDATQRCPDQKGNVIWYDECLLHYSDSSIMYTSGLNNSPLMMNETEVTVEPSRFHQLLLELMHEAATQAATDPKRFATRKGNSTTSQPLYGLVQCTQDLSTSDCSRCLQESIANLQSGRIGGRSLISNCYSRYELYLFYNESMTASLPPPPPSSLTRPEGKSEVSSSIIIAIVAAITVSGVLSVAGYCFLTRRSRKKYNTIQEEIAGIGITTVESLQFDFGTIQAATNRFSTDNKLGAGGFGEVYKAWNHWRDGTPMQLLDSNLIDSHSRNEVNRYIQVGLLCVQDDAAARPTMATVVLMLNSYYITLPLPQQPAFFHGRKTELTMQSTKCTDSDQSTSMSMPFSVNDASITELYPR
ncbi:hypothetical protein Dsin_027810 [Dipteronia sinensis]|uniref:Gnk2-homologous domain-containing protein n=1 Tax=Dipteronia sinensis TaxID=43782 RepID=A0AAD9ZPV9_9ROSI|nr:hypothetical protein Dsin_027810 [Dipteronia sinensis]